MEHSVFEKYGWLRGFRSRPLASLTTPSALVTGTRHPATRQLAHWLDQGLAPKVRSECQARTRFAADLAGLRQFALDAATVHQSVEETAKCTLLCAASVTISAFISYGKIVLADPRLLLPEKLASYSVGRKPVVSCHGVA